MVTKQVLEAAFNGRRVLITGHTGFKGTWLTLWMRQLGAQVAGYALPPEGADSHFSLLNLGAEIDHNIGDVRDLQSLSKCFDNFQPEVVFHLAAQPLVRQSYSEPKETFDVNVTGSVNVLEACRHSEHVRALVYVTSDKCYRNKEWIWGYRENDELGGYDPYSASKAAAEVVFSSYMDSFFRKRPDFGAASVRAGNVIGGGDWAVDRIIPDCIRALLRNEPIHVRNPTATRPWQHVLEPLWGYLLIAARLLEDPKNFSGPWNFGPNSSSVRAVSDLVTMITSQWGSGSVEYSPQVDAPHEAQLLHLNCDKAHQKLGWLPKWEPERAITESIEWYQTIARQQPARNISVAQIQRYMESP